MRLVVSFLIIVICCCQSFGQASLKFDGIDDYVYVPSYASLNWEQEFTLETELLQPDFSHSSRLTIAEYYNREKQKGWHWYLTEESLVITLGKETYQTPYKSTKKDHLVVARQGASLYFYANGKLLVQQTIASGSTSSCEDCELFLGNQADFATPFKGALTRLRLWNQAIQLEDLNTPTKALVGCWSFEEGKGQFINNHASPLHYGRLGKTFYADEQDAAWQAFDPTTASSRFVIENKNPKEGDPIQLLLLGEHKSSFYWLINREKYTPEQLSTATFASGMNVIQLVEDGEQGRKVSSQLVTIDAALKTCLTDELMQWRKSPQGRKSEPKSRIVSSPSTGALESTVVSNPNIGGPYVIPVVFHIIGNTQAELSAFTTNRIQAQLDKLNAEFGPYDPATGVGNNTNIRFCLAKRLPVELTDAGRTWASFGTATTPGEEGITYTLNNGNLNIDDFDLTDDGLIDVRLPSVLPFDPEEYLSIYVTPLVTVGNNTSSTQGVANVGSSGEPVDGIGVGHAAFIGTGTTPTPVGKVLVHEVGHWLSLLHVFGGTDFVCDTYDQNLSTTDYNTNVAPVNSCSDPYGSRAATPTCAGFVAYNQGENHMDYWTDNCLSKFTAGQIARMYNCLDNDRTFVHSQLNLINTGVQNSQPTACVQAAEHTADFSISTLEACDGFGSFVVEGYNPPSGTTVTYNWQVTWSAANGATPAPTATIQHSNPTGRLNEITIAGTNGTAAGLWKIELTVNGANVVTSDIDVTVLDCSSNSNRYRKTTDFANNDWELEGISVVTGISEDAQGTPQTGYMVAGTAINSTPKTGVLMFLDELGDVIWRKSIAHASDVHFYDIAASVTYNGITDCYALTGSIENNGVEEVLVMIVDKTGTVLYQKGLPMGDDSGNYPYSMGKQIVQLSSAFNNQLAIVGYTQDYNVTPAKQTAFVVGVDPSNTTTPVQWSQFYNTNVHSTDHDYMESVVETSVLINGTSTAALIISGDGNRDNYSSSSLLISCITVSGSTVTEVWKDYYETTNNSGSYSSSGTVADNGRVFVMGYGQISHGTLLFEVDPNTGARGEFFLIRNFRGDELLIDQGAMVMFGREYNGGNAPPLNAFKIALPVDINSSWPNSNTAIARNYDNTFFPAPSSTSLGVFGKQNFVLSPNGGYMGINMVTLGQATAAFNSEMTLLKLDDQLLTACSNSSSIQVSSLPNPFSQDVTVISSTELVGSPSSFTTTATNGGSICMIEGCPTTLLAVKSVQKCEDIIPLLVSDVVPTGANYSYQWSPATDLDDPTVMEPNTAITVDQEYTLVVTNTITGCVAMTVSYRVDMPRRVTHTETQIACNDPTIPNNTFAFDLSGVPSIQNGYTYQWFPTQFLDNANVLEPNCSAISDINYTLIATPTPANPNCNGIRVDYQVLINDQFPQIIDAFCLDENAPGHYDDFNQVQVFQSRINLEDLFNTFFGTLFPNNNNLIPANGSWEIETLDPTISNVINSPPRFINADPSIALTTVTSGQVEFLTYDYPDATAPCGTRSLKIRVVPTSILETNDAINICAGETVNFQANSVNLDIALNPRTVWQVSSLSNCTAINNVTLLSNPPTTVDNFTHTFLGSPNCTQYEVTRTVLYDCPDPNNPGGTAIRGIGSNRIFVDVLSNIPSINYFACFGGSLLVTPLNNVNPAIRWYEVGNSIAIATGQNFQPPTPGHYYAEVTGTQGCSFVTDPYYFNPQPFDATVAALTPYNGQQISCVGANDGQATATGTGGGTPYTYQWDANANNQTTATAINLSAGTYQVTITDLCLESIVKTITLQDPPPITSTWTAIDAACAHAGSATILPSGGVGGYTYQWDANANSQTTATASNLSAGSYEVTITDANGCTATNTVQVGVGAPPQVQLTSSQTSCTNVGITTSISNGTSPYTYLWSNGATSADLSSGQIASSGTYSVTVTDVNGCTTTGSVGITVPPQVQLTTNQTNCNNISITNAIANGTAPYAYLWSTGATTADLSGSQITTAGNYCVTVTDANGCTATACATIDPVADIDFSKSVSQSQAQVGDAIEYTIFINNNCQIAATFDLTDVLPAGLLINTNSLGNFTYNSIDRTLTQRVTVAGFSSQTYTYRGTILADGTCASALTLNNQITAELVADPTISFTDNALVEVIDATGSGCNVSNLSVSFAQVEQAGVLLPMTGAVNATNTPQNVVVNGTWTLGIGQAYEFTSGSTIIMESGAQIVVSNGAQLTIDGTTIEGCTCLWHRILVESGGELIVIGGSQLKDAQYAIETQDAAILTIEESNFEDNFIGWYMAPTSGPTSMNQQVTLNGFNNNYFASRSLKPAFLNAGTTPTLTVDGQSTSIALPSGGVGSRLIGLAGVYLWDGNSIAISQATPSNNNTFEYLVTGIATFNTNLLVNNAYFRFIRENTIYYASNLGFQGAAIHAQGATGHLPGLQVVGTRNTSNITTYNALDVGVSAIRAQVDVDYCVMNQIAEAGIRALNCDNSSISIKLNRIDNVELVGIECENNKGTTQTIIAYNNIYMQNSTINANQFRAGISVDNGYNLVAEDNTVQSTHSQFGMYIHRVDNARLVNNIISMDGLNTGIIRTGIAVDRGQSTLTCNVVNGNFDVRNDVNTRAISGNSLDASTWTCNQLQNTYVGAHFEGGSNLILKGTVFEDHEKGLFLSSNAIIGTQFNHGNMWVASTMPVEAENQNTSNLLASQFSIHPNYPIPSNVLPANSSWFVGSGGGVVYNCNTAGDEETPLCGEPMGAFPEEQLVVDDSRATAHQDDYTIKNRQENWDVNLYPNPAFQYLTLESSQVLSKGCQVEVYNALGQQVPVKVQLQTEHQVILNIEQLLPGVYTLNLLEKGKQLNKTFVVSKP